MNNTDRHISLILGHPDKNSFNHAIALAASNRLRENGYEVRFHDLCDEGFDPMLPASEPAKDATVPPEIEAHCREIASAHGIIIVHPNWWGQPPAILKGWVDRVLRAGVAYEFIEGDSGEGVPVGLLKAKAAIVFNTSNTLAEREATVFGDPLESIWRNCIFDLCGVGTFYREMFRVIVTSTEEERQGWLRRVEDVVGMFFPPVESSPGL